jgi:hypothetical protein
MKIATHLDELISGALCLLPQPYPISGCSVVPIAMVQAVSHWSGTVETSGVPRNFFGVGGGGVQQIQLRTEGGDNGDLGAVSP